MTSSSDNKALVPTIIKDEQEIEEAHRLDTEIKRCIQQGREIWVELAARLYHFHELKGWKRLGYTSFEEYLASPDIELGRSQVFNHIAAFRELVILRDVEVSDLAQVDMTKAVEVLPAVRRGDVPWKEAFHDLLTLAVRDVRTKYRNYEKAAGEDWRWVKCGSCGGRMKQYLGS